MRGWGQGKVGLRGTADGKEWLRILEEDGPSSSRPKVGAEACLWEVT